MAEGEVHLTMAAEPAEAPDDGAMPDLSPHDRSPEPAGPPPEHDKSRDEAESTPAARFAPPPLPPVPPTVIVRQTALSFIVAAIVILGLIGAGLLAWQLYLIRGEMAQLAALGTRPRTIVHTSSNPVPETIPGLAQLGPQLSRLTAETTRVANSVGQLGDAATQANELAGQALVTGTRPWIGVDTVAASPIVAGQPLTIEVRVRNSGRTPSTDVEGLFLVYISPAGKPPTALDHRCKSCKRSVVLPNGVVTYRLSVRDSVMTPDEVQRIESGKDAMWIIGRLDYHDGEGDPHTTQSCLYYRATGAGSFSACNDGNAAD
ncbi:MAG: hypothetical protein ACREE3_00615 [Stellaceae bacterium]